MQKCSADEWNFCTFRSSNCSLCVDTASWSVEANHSPIQCLKVDPLLHWDLWPLARTGASDTCVARGSGGGEGLTSLSASLRGVRSQIRVKGLTPGPEGLLRTVDPCDRPLDPAYCWAQGAFLGPGPCGGSFHPELRERIGQGRTNEVRAAVLGDLCLSEAPSAFWLGDGAQS